MASGAGVAEGGGEGEISGWGEGVEAVLLGGVKVAGRVLAGLVARRAFSVARMVSSSLLLVAEMPALHASVNKNNKNRYRRMLRL
jgi:hypothetical protein